MNLGLIFGAWCFTQYGWRGVWAAFAIWCALDVLWAVFWPTVGHDIGFALGAATRQLIQIGG